MPKLNIRTNPFKFLDRVFEDDAVALCRRGSSANEAIREAERGAIMSLIIQLGISYPMPLTSHDDPRQALEQIKQIPEAAQHREPLDRALRWLDRPHPLVPPQTP